MQKKYGKDGFMALSVHLDANDADEKAQVPKRLKSAGANFTSVILDASSKFWQDKLGFQSYPCIYVFNREGKWTRFHADDKKYENKKLEVMLEDVDSLVQTLLQKK
jgi:hypothetical protein